MVERNLGVTHRKAKEFSTEISIVRLDHDKGVDTLSRSHRKGMGILRADSIPYWGRASDILDHFV